MRHRKPRTPEHCEKIRLSKLGSRNPMWGKTTSDKQKAVVRANRGSRHYAWKGGKATERERKSLSETKRRALAKQSTETFSLLEWEMMKWIYDYTCPACFRAEPEIKITADHIVPLSLGGSNDISNIQPLCQSCNSGKRNLHSTCYPYQMHS